MADIPERLRTALDRYVTECRWTGGFLEAVLSNDLRLSVFRADEESLAALPAIVRYCWNRLPAACWGDHATVEAWLATGVPGELDGADV